MDVSKIISTTRTFTVTSEPDELERRVEALVNKAKEKAVAEIEGNGRANRRVYRALVNRFRPYILEAETIAGQLLTSKYARFKEETRDFLGALVNVVACPDGRISVLSLTDPRVTYVHRVPRGRLPTRLSTGKRELPIPANTQLRAGVWTAIRKRKEAGVKKPKLVALMGPHINSFDPVHGCGGATEELSGMGSGMPVALATLRYGGARNYFRILTASGEYYCFDNFVKIAGGEGTTVGYVHDLYSQGVILGLDLAWKKLNKSQSLRENLLRLHDKKEIIMSEILVKRYKKKIYQLAAKFDPNFDKRKTLNYRKPQAFAQNAMLVGRIAQQLTLTEEKKGYKVLPATMSKNYSKEILRIACYHLLRSVVYLTLGAIKPGKHWLVHHPEQLLRVGPIGADFNVKTIAFIETAPPSITDGDMQAAFVLYRLLGRFLPTMDVDLTKEARVIMVTGGFDQSIYKDDEALEVEYDKVATMVIDDAAQVKGMVKRAVREGAAVVLPVIHHLGNRSVIDVV